MWYIMSMSVYIHPLKQAGLYLFSFSARGRGNYDNNGYISGDSEEARRIRFHNLRSREADRDACFDWK